MSRYLLDTNHAAWLLRGNPVLERRVLACPANIALCRPVVGELWFMVFNSTRAAENQALLERLLKQVPVWEFDADAAREFGTIRVEQRRKGRPIPQIDAQIAAIARLNGLTLLTADTHFGLVERVQAENWLQG